MSPVASPAIFAANAVSKSVYPVAIRLMDEMRLKNIAEPEPITQFDQDGITKPRQV
ncbi:hypothetical protein CES85_4942 [Ochrobactrum quorumnocens]|uniref:Uncharacterized protein n=1 Tax=Ochrobactrum quorumnocens TaxID=271865 RepID=A0A248UC90_9HYPH|nr:hypothetical protein [[Ochrobactrum] quorumnocens]ASV84150.1 hypothetical protein CES85_4942 [[Ochrobactrum] quorumnocens]